eukprot:4168103-Alexandrium_andersonii.AAC.1
MAMRSYVLVASACQKNVCGFEWLQARQAKFVQWPFERANEQHTFRFGSQPLTSSLGRYRVPIALAGHVGEIRISAVPEK